jgi:hypothetical protein
MKQQEGIEVVNVIEMGFWRMSAVLVMLGLMCTAALGGVPCDATEVWSDNFDDGNLDGWVADANTIVVDGTLRGSRATEVYRPCNLTSGTWSFDMLDIGNWIMDWEPGLYVYFMSTHPDIFPQMTYCLRVTHGTTSAGLKYLYAITRFNGESTVTLASGDGLEGPSLKGTLHHIKITRTAAGQMSVYVNGTLVMETTDNEISTSECFKMILGYDYAIDNIVVDDASPGIPMELLAVGAGAVAIVVVTLVALKRRR